MSKIRAVLDGGGHNSLMDTPSHNIFETMRRGDYKALNMALNTPLPLQRSAFPVSAKRYNALVENYNEMIEDIDMLLRFTDFLRSELDAQCHKRAEGGRVETNRVRLG